MKALAGIISGGGGLTSAFDDMVAGLSPDLYLDFQDADFATLTDISGNDHASTKIGSVEASVGAALRTTKAQSAHFPYIAGSGAMGGYYIEGPNRPPAQDIYDSTHHCLQLSMKRSLARNVGDQIMCGVAPHDGNANATAYIAINAQDQIFGKARGTTGNYNVTDPGTQALNTPHIITAYFNGTTNYKCLYIDGVALDPLTWNKTLVNWGYGYVINARYSVSYDMDEWYTDHHAMWAGTTEASIPTSAEVLAMHAAYLAEI